MALSEKMLKDKVKEVRLLAPNFSTNDVVLVLEHYDHNVERSVAALLENGGMNALQTWTQSSKTSSNKLKKKYDKKDVNSDKQGDQKKTPNPDLEKTLNGLQKHNGVAPDLEKKNVNNPINQSKNPRATLEKSYKELQRQTTSLVHLKLVFAERMEKSYKRVSEVFKELQQQLNERQNELLLQLDKSKEAASQALCAYETKAAELKMKIDRSPSMSANDVALLRMEIKDFVNHKRHYEDLAQSPKFNCDFNKILLCIQEFGEVPPIKGPVSTNEHQAPDEIVTEQASVTPDPDVIPNRVLNQSESLVKYEAKTASQTSSDSTVEKDAATTEMKPNRGSEFGRGFRGGRRPYRSGYSRRGGTSRVYNGGRQGGSVGIK